MQKLWVRIPLISILEAYRYENKKAVPISSVYRVYNDGGFESH